ATETTGDVLPLRVARRLGSCADNGDDAENPRQATPRDTRSRRLFEWCCIAVLLVQVSGSDELDPEGYWFPDKSHSLIDESQLPEASVVPSGLYATEYTPPACPLRVACSLPVLTSHSLIVSSQLPEAKVLPSGLYATEYTRFLCPLRVARSLPVATSQRMIV